MTCTCTMAQKLVGDGCYKCNPEIHIDHLNDELAELRQQRDELLEALKFVVDVFKPVKKDLIFSKRMALTKAQNAIEEAMKGE